MNYKRKSRRRFFLLMRSRTPPISSQFRRGFEPPKPHPSVRHWLYFSQNQQEMSAVYAVVDSECPTCCYLIKMLLKYSFSTTTLDHKQVSKRREQSKNLVILPHPPYSPDLVPSDCHLFGALKDAFCLKRFVDVDEVVEEVAASTGFKLVQKRDRCSFFLLVQGC